MITKKFDHKLHTENDADCKEVVLTHLGPEAKENADRYGVDIIYGKRLIEVERKTHWRFEDEFPYATVQIPHRKKKFRDIGAEFWILNRYLDRAIIVQASSMLPQRVKVVKNRYVQDGERFYCVPVSECTIVKLKR